MSSKNETVWQHLMSNENGSVWRHLINQNAEIAKNSLKTVLYVCEILNKTEEINNSVKQLDDVAKQHLLFSVEVINKRFAELQSTQRSLLFALEVWIPSCLLLEIPYRTGTQQPAESPYNEEISNCLDDIDEEISNWFGDIDIDEELSEDF